MVRTAEVVSPGHPDKMCDRISDSILDLFLQQDPDSRVAVETAGGNGLVLVTGEVTSKGEVSKKQIVEAVREITGDPTTIVLEHLNSQSPEIAQGVDTGGAGDQGIMTGYACNENSEYLPQEYFLARELNKYIYRIFPTDGKTQVTIDGDNIRVVASFQKADTPTLRTLVVTFFYDKYPQYNIEAMHINPAGEWNIGGFTADAGLTGRKLAVDNYGPRVPIGGGAFSGKDATKVDRSAAYMARRVAVDLLEKNNAKEVFVQLAYAIGYDQPLQATAVIDGVETSIEGYDLSPRGIIEFLDLRKPIFKQTASFGHMGAGFNWK